MKTISGLVLACAFFFGATCRPAWSAPALQDLPKRQWTWIDVDGTYCANGSATGFAVNPVAGARQLLLYLQGGGMCTDEASCWGQSPAAMNLNGYNADSFAAEPFVENEIFKRGAAHPFNRAVMAFVPYCTGDLHIGSGTAGLPTTTFFMGGSNLAKYMTMLHSAYPQLEHVWITGISAGGAGALLNHWFATQAFGVQVDVIDDSAPPMAAPKVGVPAVWQIRIPPGCTACAQDLLTGYYAFSKSQLPASKFAFLAYNTDTVLPSYFQMPSDEFQPAYRATLETLRHDPNARLLTADAASHVVLAAPQHNAQRFTVRWLSRMIRRPDMWANEFIVPR